MNGASRKLIFASLFLICLSFVLSGGIAVADSSVTRTNLTIHGKSGGVAPGTAITISGKLNSERASCRSGQTIQLFSLVGGVVQVGMTVTDTKGNYSFTQTVNADSAFQTHFAGSVSGVHPNTHACALSTSRILKVNVKGSSVLGESGGAGPVVLGSSSGAAFTGGDLLTPFIFFVLLLISGVAAVLVSRRRTPTRSSG
jgi:hypothetical protein